CGDEEFFPLNSTEIEHPKEGEVIYRDNHSVLCRRWNWRESDKTKMTTHTRNVLILAEGLPPVSSSEMDAVSQILKTRILHFCGGTCFTQILDRERTRLSI
ncbi:phenylalanine--tRNA ligase beta subunit-related protein, partial [Acidobacteriota bacterium]